MKRSLFSLILFVALICLAFAQPSGANVNVINSSRAVSGSPGEHDAYAGNLTEINLYGQSITRFWQGYFGNVSGAIRLSDSNGNNLYNWSLASPNGQVYATYNSTINWTGIACFNWTAEGENLETNFGINSTNVDGVNETFSSTNHPAFLVGSKQINQNTCMSLNLFDDSGQSVEGKFTEVLLSDGVSAVFTSIINQNMLGFDNRSHDFQMIVLENGKDTQTTRYYFYVELE